MTRYFGAAIKPGSKNCEGCGAAVQINEKTYPWCTLPYGDAAIYVSESQAKAGAWDEFDDPSFGGAPPQWDETDDPSFGGSLA